MQLGSAGSGGIGGGRSPSYLWSSDGRGSFVAVYDRNESCTQLTEPGCREAGLNPSHLLRGNCRRDRYQGMPIARPSAELKRPGELGPPPAWQAWAQNLRRKSPQAYEASSMWACNTQLQATKAAHGTMQGLAHRSAPCSLAASCSLAHPASCMRQWPGAGSQLAAAAPARRRQQRLAVQVAASGGAKGHC